jgi:hypothetical protein
MKPSPPNEEELLWRAADTTMVWHGTAAHTVWNFTTAYATWEAPSGGMSGDL